MKLGDYLTGPLLPFDFVRSDCCRWADGWVQARGHRSPIKALGLHWTTEKGALRVIKRGGGLVDLWTRGMTAVGVPEAAEPQPGDVAVIERPTLDRLNQALAIYTGSRWASLCLAGMEYGPATPLKVWRP